MRKAGRAFYAFPEVEDEVAPQKLLKKWSNSCPRGSAFGENGKGHIRISYATSREFEESAGSYGEGAGLRF